jgi:hypothetical protein
MPDLLWDDLKQQISERKTVAVVGAGVSILASAGAACASWAGLLIQQLDDEFNTGLETTSSS